MASTMPEDIICFSCGRVISGASGAAQRSRGDFRRSSTRGASRAPKRQETAKMAAAQAVGSPAQRRVTKAQAALRHSRKSSMKNLMMVGAVSFIFLFTPAQVQLVEMAIDLKAEGMNMFKQGREYPVEAEFTYDKVFTVIEDNDPATGGTPGGDVLFKRQMGIPYQRTTNGISPHHFTSAFESETIQEIKSLTLITEGQEIAVPLDGTARSRAMAVITPSGKMIYWPAATDDGTGCKHTQCVMWEGTVSDGEEAILTVRVNYYSKSWTWWQDSAVYSDIEGNSWGINVDNSGTFDNIRERGDGAAWDDFGKHSQWYYSSERSEYLINGDHPLIQKTALDIMATLPESLSDNTYAFARASFDFLVEKITYNDQAELHPVSGPTCIESGTGDCDEVSNAFMSLMRVKQIPTWYEFGILLNTHTMKWEGHAWANVMLPLGDEWCESKEIVLDSCYINGEVDVVNNKWLLHTPTSVTDWIEEADSSGELVKSAYRGWTFSPSNGGRVSYSSSIETVGQPEYIGGTYIVSVDPESF